MSSPKGKPVPIAPMRRFIMDLIHFARKVPSVPVSKVMDVHELGLVRSSHPAKPSWSILFMKAFANVAEKHSALQAILPGLPVGQALRASRIVVRTGSGAT